MRWMELCRLASDARCELLLLDSCLSALAHSHNAALHARTTADIPNVETLCTALDEHRVPIPHEVEAQVVMRHRFVEFIPPPAPAVSRNRPATA